MTLFGFVSIHLRLKRTATVHSTEGGKKELVQMGQLHRRAMLEFEKAFVLPRKLGVI